MVRLEVRISHSMLYGRLFGINPPHRTDKHSVHTARRADTENNDIDNRIPDKPDYQRRESDYKKNSVSEHRPNTNPSHKSSRLPISQYTCIHDFTSYIRARSYVL